MPKICPICGGKAEQRAIGSGQKSKSVGHFCANKNCFAINRRQLRHFASRRTMDIEGLGPKIIDQLMASGLIREAADIYELTEGDLAPLVRFADKSAKKLIEAIDKSRQVSLARFINALGILHVGEETAIDLANYFGSVDKLKSVSKENLNKIANIGEVVAKSIVDWFGDAHNQKVLERLLGQIKIESPKVSKKKQVFKNMKIVLTGELINLSRDQAKQLIRERGGEVASSVSTKTDLVVVGENPGSKFEKAKKLGLKIIGENEFKQMTKN